METITLYDYSGAVKAVVQPEQVSEQVCELMGVDVVNLAFTTPVPVSLTVGTFAMVFGKRYSLNTRPTVNKIADRNYEYSLTLESDTQQLGKVQYLFHDRNNFLAETEGSLTGDARAFMDLLILNLNRVYPGVDYKLGTVVESATKTLDFSGANCLEALGRLASEFETEWIIEGNKISLYRRQTNSGIVLGYGNGLYKVTLSAQNNSNPITRVYGYGSDRNIGSNYRFGAKRLRMADKIYLEKNTELLSDGTYNGVVEVTKIFEDIYPRREGSITAVTSPFIFIDSTIDFNLNDNKMPGVTSPKITFNSGNLAGYTFDITDYNHAAKRFTIAKNSEEQTVDVPSALLSPAIGDKYVLIDILMPNSYISNAEAELKQAVQKFLDESSVGIPELLSVVCDPINFKNTGKTFSIGQLVTVQEPSLNIDKTTRVIKFSRNLRQPSIYAMDLADSVKENVIVKIINK